MTKEAHHVLRRITNWLTMYANETLTMWSDKSRAIISLKIALQRLTIKSITRFGLARNFSSSSPFDCLVCSALVMALSEHQSVVCYRSRTGLSGD